MLDRVIAKRDDVYALARRHKAEKLWVFGSCARKEETPASDIDFLVKFKPDVSLHDELALEEAFRQLLGRNVDIVRNTQVRSCPRFAWRVCKEAVAI